MRGLRFIQLILAILLLAACAQTSTPAPAPSLPATAAPTRALASPHPATPAASPTRAGSPAPAATRRAQPTTLPASPTAPPAARADSPWPNPVSALDFGVPAGNSYGPRALAIHPDLRRLYARTHPLAAYGADAGTVTVFDLDTEQVLDVVETGLDGYAEGNLLVDTVRDRLYALNPGDTTATVLDAVTLEAVDTLDGVACLALDEGTGVLYVAGLSSLRALDAESAELLVARPLDDVRYLALTVDPAAGRVYLAHEKMGGGYSLAVLDADTLDPVFDVPLPGGPQDLLAAGDPLQLFVTLDDGERNLLWVLDAGGNLLEESILGDWTQHTYLALDAAGGRLFLTQDAYRQQGVLVRDLETDSTERLVDLAAAPGRLAWDPVARTLYASLTYVDRLVAVDPQAREVTGVLPTALTLVDVAVDPARGRLLVTDNAGRLHVLESDGSRELATLTAGGELAIDSHHGRYYVGGGGAGQVQIWDAQSLTLIGTVHTRGTPVADPYHDDTFYLVRRGVYVASLDTLTTTMAISDTLPESPGFSPNPAAVGALVDPDSGRLLVLINNGVPGSNNGNYLHVYEPDTFERIFADFERSPIYLDVDPAGERAYVSRIYMDLRSTSLLLDGREYADRIDGLFGPLRLDAGLGTLYLSSTGDDEGHLLLIDAVDLDVLGSVPIPGGFSLRALDTERHLLYLATSGGALQIWSATGGDLPVDARAVRAPLPMTQISRLYAPPGTDSIFAGSLYRSDDRGRTWYFLGTGLPVEGVTELAISPDLADDETLFAARTTGGGNNLGVWKSDTAGSTWRMADDGLDDLAVVDLAISAAYATDHTLFALGRSQGLFRSTDAGETWESLADRYLPPGTTYEPPGLIAISPTYGEDHTLYVAHQGLHRSTDGGETWTQVVDTGAASVALAPDYATSRTLYGWFGHTGLLRSADGGDNWQPVSAGLLIDGYGTPRLLLPPDNPGGDVIYFVWEPGSPSEATEVWRSTDAGMTWQRLADPLPQSATRLELTSDGSAFIGLDEQGQLARWPISTLRWEVPTLPALDQIQFDGLTLPPNFRGDKETSSTQGVLYAVNRLAGVLFSPDAGLTWTDTAYPQRHLFGALDGLLALPSGEALAATPLGLYRYTPGEEWDLVEGGLPPGAGVTGLQRGDDGSLRLVTAQGDVSRVFLSTDQGTTWIESLPSLPVPAIADDLYFSPAFSDDHTAFLATSQGRPLRSIEGGPWQEIGPPEEWQLSALDVSPALDRDGIVFVRTNTHTVWRSTDLGDTWQQVSGPWPTGVPPRGIAQGTGYRLPALTFSPAFGSDRVAWTQVENTLYRSSDAGETWRAVLDLAPGIVHTVFSPAYGADGIVYLLQGQTLYHTTDRGASWQPQPPAAWSAFDEMQLAISPTFEQDQALFAWNMSGLAYLSSDAGRSWSVASAGLPPDGLRQVTFSPAYAGDGILYAVPYQGGIYRYAGDGSWRLATQVARTPRTPPTSTPAPTRVPAPAPTATAVPGCEIEPGRFADAWRPHATPLGCPTEQARQLTLAEQPFEHGRMIWDPDETRIYVLLDAGTWQVFEDTWQEGVDPTYDPDLPPPPRQPQRGFGKVWREALGGPEAAIGWAIEPERASAGWRQRFERGSLYWTDTAGGTLYLLYQDGTWQ